MKFEYLALAKFEPCDPNPFVRQGPRNVTPSIRIKGALEPQWVPEPRRGPWVTQGPRKGPLGTPWGPEALRAGEPTKIR